MTAVAVTALPSCTTPAPVTWGDIAGTIPSSVDYMVSVNTTLLTDKALADVWDTSDVGALVREAMEWEGGRPDYVVIMGLGGVQVVTWPLPDTEAAAAITDDWDAVSLNGTVDAKMKVKNKASIVVSSTQAWVVSSANGADRVNDVLSGAMSAPASRCEPYNTLITTVPASLSGVVPFNDRYYTLNLEQRGATSMALVVEAEHADMKPAAIIDDLKPLPTDTVMMESTPFLDIRLKRGDLPRILRRVASVMPSGAANIGVGMIARVTEPVTGTLSVRVTGRDAAAPDSVKVAVTLPFGSNADAEATMKSLKSITDLGVPGKLDYEVKGTSLIIKADIDDQIADKLRAGRPLQLDPSVPKPSIVAHGEIEIDKMPVDLTLAANLSRATVVMDYYKTEALPRALALISALLNGAL